MKHTCRMKAAALLIGAWFCPMAAIHAAEDSSIDRDPMRWPSALRAASELAAQPATTGEAPKPTGRQLLFVDGRRYVLQGTRRIGIGERLGEAVLVRIEPDAIWLRQDGVTRREALYPKIEWRSAAPASAASSARPSQRAAKTKSKPATPAAAPVSEVQP